ncbi:surfactant protein B [Oesophagostomum dentatum]|uniref:Surfactant protein B n=1 Tax=Oesophagostomum dentatum TaxID=61180 RepID=A0A0B1SQW2_OESDE|nr:surfactant protein B [Oesophagostomum dentatum]
MRAIVILALVLSTAMMVEGYAKYWDNPLCSMCKDLVVDLIECAGKNIEEKANDFCEKNAPFFLVDTCKGLIKSNLDVIIEQLKIQAEPRTVCKLIKLCS